MFIFETLLLLNYLLLYQVSCEDEDSLGGGGSGMELDQLPCDLATCIAPMPEERIELLSSPSNIEGLPPSDCLLDCSNQVYSSSCSQCTFSKPVFPDSSILALELSDSLQPVAGNVNINITGISETFNSQQTSMVVVVDTEYTILIDLSGFACSEFLVEYTLSNNMVGRQTVCLNYTPPAPSNLTYGFTSICDDGDYDSAAITINWDHDKSFSYWVLGYNITLFDGVEFSVTYMKAKNDSSIIISDGIELNKEYTLIVSPYPAGFSTKLEINTNLMPSRLVEDCWLVLDPVTVTYTFTFSWTITDFDCSITNRLVRFEVDLSNFTINANSFRLNQKDVGETAIVYPMLLTSSYTHEFTGIPFVPYANYEARLTTFYQGQSSPFANNINQIKCQKSIVPLPPTIVTEINVTDFTYLHDNIVDLTISWIPPEYINGHDVIYSLWVGSKALSIDTGLPSGSTLNDEIRYMKDMDDLLDSLTLDSVRVTSTVLYVQLIASNDLCMMVTPSCYSNWSEPLEYQVPPPLPPTINIDTEDWSSTSTAYVMPSSSDVMETNYQSTPSKVPDSTNFTRLIPPLAGVVGGLFVTVVTLVMIVACCCCFGGRLLKRDIAMDPMIKMDVEPKWGGGESGDYSGKILSHHIPFQSLDFEEWEIPRDFLEVYEKETLGSGCFGEVFKGNLQMHYVHTKKRLNHNHKIHQKLPNIKPKEWLPVAVKRLKRTADGKERADFLKEIDTMIKVSETDSELKRFVVNTLGCCRLHEPILLVVEYVSCGDLLHYLRAEKKKVQGDAKESSEPIPYLESLTEYSHLEPKNDSISNLEGNLSSKHLLDFSRQIAAGMEFLSGLYIVHRDLACRNILVNSDKTLKISDFGLARTVPQDEVYTLTNHGRLPLRWMALESIFQREFTSASDVWSFGVVLWEICTMGKFPYGSLSEKELLQRMKKGYRLEQPDNCSQEIYEMMHRCWHPSPSKRPKFSDLHKLLDTYLTKYTQDKYPYMDLDSNTPYTFDQLVPKSLSDYQTHMKEVLTIEDVASSNGDVVGGADSHNPIYLDNKLESGGTTMSDLPPTHLQPTTRGGHVSVYRLQDHAHSNNTRQNVEPYDHLKDDNDEVRYDRAGMMETLNTIYMDGGESNMAADIMDDYYYQDELWYKKLSTITEVSNEDD